MCRKFLLMLVLSILVASTLGGCGSSPPTLTMVSTSGGNVSVMRADTASWVEAEIGMSLEPGDIIESGDNCSAGITFLDGSTIELQAGTKIEVVSLNISTDTGSATIKLKQTVGSIIFRVARLIDPASRYEVETPTGSVAIRGSAVEISVSEDGTTQACNLEGDIWAFAQGVELQVPEGRCCIIRPGQPPKLICDLTISSTSGGSITVPGQGTFAYDEGNVVDLVAEADEGYQFGGWTGDVGTIGNVTGAATTITMNDNYFITADFEPTVLFSCSGNFSGSITSGVFDITSGTVEIGPSTYIIINTPPVGYNSSSGFNQFRTDSTTGQLFAEAITLTNSYVMGLAAVYNQASPTSLLVTFGRGLGFPGSTAVTLGFDGPVIAGINATGYLQTSGSAFILSASGTAG
jgi:hypothetical protein